MKIERQGVTLELVRGDIATQPGFDAVVNAANAQLMPGGGVAGAIHRAAGPGLARECRPLAPIAPGQAVITGGHGLPNPHVIHCLGPVWGRDEPAEELLRSCYRRALELAEENGLESVVFPAVSTGVFGYPLGAAARAALDEVLLAIPGLTSVRRIRFALHGASALQAHEEALEALLSERA
jgi:O-acetyl-ADP-ribose deacetylase (regulator of RNase III)